MKKSSIAVCLMIPFLAFIALMPASEVSAADSKAVRPAEAQAKTVDTKVDDTKKTPVYSYNPIGKPDPFKPFIEDEISAKKRQEKLQALPISPLQRAEIGEFRLVGITGNEKSRRAIVQDVKGKFYPIHLGTYIGRNNGKVVKILADRLIVEEPIKVQAGKTKTRTITMKLRKDEGEENP